MFVSRLAAALVAVLTNSAAWAQTDHLQCFKIKDLAGKAAYTLDLVPGDGDFSVAAGCEITLPAKQLCIDVAKTNVVPPAPGGVVGSPAQKYLCYKVKCPKQELATAALDQFGTHSIELKSSSLLCAPAPANCGDTAGPGGTDVPCTCGDTVVTDTVLQAASDPVAANACNGNGLTLASGVALDLGGNTLTGAGQGTGLTIPAGGTASGGTVRQFSVGVALSDAGMAGQTSVSGLMIQANSGHGVTVELSNTGSRVVFEDMEVLENGGHGFFLRSAPGLSNLDDVTYRIEKADYGFVLHDPLTALTNIVHDNVGDGIHVGDATQPADLAAYIGDAEIFGNGGSGIVLMQEGSPADCGSSGGQPGCSGATIANTSIHDNTGSGAVLQSGVIIPLYIASGPVPIDLGLGFVQNIIFHNAMAGPGCIVAQNAPQVFIAGATSLDDTMCASSSPGAPCEELSDGDGVNYHCISTAVDCFVGWDLRGDLEPNCPNGLHNAIFGYNISDGGNSVTVGARAENNSAADMSHNEWGSSTSSQNVTQGAGSFIRAELTCGTRGCPAP
jgi:hypothetical protein